MKKKVSVCLSVVLFLSVIFSMSGIKVHDENLLSAELAASCFFKYEGEGKEEVVYSSYIKGLSGENEFILVESKDNAYAIFAKDTMELIEYSSKGQSPYKNSSAENNFYAGPGNYFKQEKNGIVNVHTKQVLTESNRLAIANKVTEKLKETTVVEENREISNIVSGDLTDLLPAEETVDLMSPGITGGGTVAPDEYSVVQRKLIPNYQYFLSELRHGVNTQAECTVVATQILLGYHNWANDGRIIENNGTNYFLERQEGNLDYLIPYNKAATSTTSEVDANDGITTFYEFLLDKINLKLEISGTNILNFMGEPLIYAKEVMSDYLTEKNISYNISQSLLGKTVIENAIDSGNPAMACINFFDIYGSSELHSVVVYGYQTFRINGTSVDGYIAHFGWDDFANGSDAYKWFNSSWLISNLTLSINHNHDFIQPTYDDEIVGSHVLECTICGVRKPTEHHDYSLYCNKNIENDSFDQHTLKCGCGYYIVQPHYYRYETCNSAVQHYCVCMCGKSYYENHFYKHGDYCWYCGYIP